ncbi:S1C family serine protease [Candidatus Enterococcus courvalinii]|uniref:Trypsin-like peptidase domain-containing protein n=1 Tax=Candidatus Enterococcus courvalinii TaxID=2815329 RepID=A0ABS3I3T6_9ENTE|nr:trypsin-like peptidase domain-containing protein [Enterococcus sp. MSG2901]MBO0482743.1 trypsin-like peptidase domain-containing protein [Enterococcus sp. MSG2901]
MDKKDVTPKMKKNNHGFWRKLGLGLVGGVLGGLITAGIFYGAMGSSFTTSSTSASGNQNSAGETVVENVKVNVESDITSAVDKVQGAVVSVINLQNQNQSSEFGQLFGQQEQSSSDENLEAYSEGSGVIYKKDGDSAYIVTNNHVVDGQQGLEVLLKDGSKVKAELVGTDAYSDLAVLKINADKVDTVASFGDSESLKVGEPAIAIGSPLGSAYANSVTSGIVSSLNRQVTSTNESNETVNINAIQTDAAINPGNSGGPLVNIEGQVIGINSSKIASTSESSSDVNVEGMGFAIPSNDVVNVINQLEKDGKVTRPALGITMVDLSAISTQQQEQVLKIPTSVTNGVIVTNVQAATPAEKAGLKQYDVITKIDDTEVSSGVELQTALYKKKVGDSVKVTYYRGSEEKTATVELTIDQSSLKQNNSNE